MHISFAILLLVMLSLAATAAPFRTPLTTGTLYVPDGYAPADGKVDVLVHFHGSAERVEKCLIESNRAAAAITVSFNGLSGVYSDPFGKDPKLFGKILDDARAKMAEHFKVKEIKIGKLVVTSFSAGFGAVREILGNAEYVNQITDVIMLDSIYAGYVQENGKNVVDPDNMLSFVAMAKHAAEGKANMLVTYSEVVPGDYASTAETAEFLARKVGAKIVPASGTDAPGMKLLAKADLKGFHARGYAGDDGPAHMNHLLSLGVFLKWTSLPEKSW